MSVDTLLSSSNVLFDLAADDLNGNGDANSGYSDGNSVSTWKDRSGNAKDFTAGNAPVYKTAITGTGLPVVRFTAASSQSLSRSYSASEHPDAITLFSVFKIPATVNGAGIIRNYTDAPTRQGVALYITTGPKATLYMGSGGSSASGASQNLDNSNFFVATGVCVKNYLQVSTSNSTTDGTAVASSYILNTVADWLIGSGTVYNTMDLARVIVVSERMSESLISQVEQQLYRDYVAAASSTDTGAHVSTVVSSNGITVTITLDDPGTNWAPPYGIDLSKLTLNVTSTTPSGGTYVRNLSGEDDLKLVSAVKSSETLVIVVNPRRQFIYDPDTVTVDMAAGFVKDGPGSSNAVVSGGAVTNSSTVAYVKPNANWVIPQFDDYSSSFYLEVDASHIDGVSRVEFYADGVQIGADVTQETRSTNPSLACYRKLVNPSDYSDGAVVFDFRVVPIVGDSDSYRDTRSGGLNDDPNGLTLYMNSGGTLTGASVYVDSAAADDTGAGTTGDPWKTIDKAIEYGQANWDADKINYINLKTGTHTRAADKTANAFANGPFVYIRRDPASTSARTDVTVDFAAKAHKIRRLKISGVTIATDDGLSIKGPATSPASAKLQLHDMQISGDGQFGEHTARLRIWDYTSHDANNAWDTTYTPDIIDSLYQDRYGVPLQLFHLIRNVTTDDTSPIVVQTPKVIFGLTMTDNKLGTVVSVAVGAISGGPFEDGEELTITGGATGRVIGNAASSPLNIFGTGGTIASGNTITGQSSGASCTASANQSGDHTDGIFLDAGVGTRTNITLNGVTGFDIQGQPFFSQYHYAGLTLRNILIVQSTNIQYYAGHADQGAYTLTHALFKNVSLPNSRMRTDATTSTWVTSAVVDSIGYAFGGVIAGILKDNLHITTEPMGSADYRISMGNPTFVDGAYNGNYDAGAVDYTPDTGSALIDRTDGTYDTDGVYGNDIGSLNTPDTPTAPSDAAFTSDGLVATVTWTNNTTFADQNIVEYNLDGAGWSTDYPGDEDGVVAADATSFVTPTLTAGTYQFRVRARNVTVYSSYSTTASATLTAGGAATIVLTDPAWGFI